MTWANDAEVIDQFRSAGLVIKGGIRLGELVRCSVEGDREKRGWYRLHEIRMQDGRYVLVGSFGVWRGTDNNAQKVSADWKAFSQEQRAAIKLRLAADRKEADAQRRKIADAAARRAQAVWCRLSEQGDSPYLQRKGIQAHGARYSPRGAVVVPMLDGSGVVHGLEIIHAKPRHGRSKETWPPGAAKKGHFFLIGPSPSGVILIAEGFATAASLFEATGLPCVVAFSANNMLPVGESIRKRYRGNRLLYCADDDFLTEGNPGITAAQASAVATDGAWVAPVFAQDRGQHKITDFNDLHATEGLHVVRTQIEARLRDLGWPMSSPARDIAPQGGGEDAGSADLRPIETVSELLLRYTLIYGIPDAVFDARERTLVSLSNMRNLCTNRYIHRAWMDSPEKRVARASELGFDPTEADPSIKCNLFGGFPVVARYGADIDAILELGYHLCSKEPNPEPVFEHMMNWLGYPRKHPGAKMKTALVIHGPQGAGKNMFVEAIAKIYAPYSCVIDQGAIEDKFNDWASRKVFAVADEVVSRQEIYHIKNKLKGLVTGETIRINPKNVGSYTEKNHMNLVFLSNETRPLDLERDDRRYIVIWTPEKLDSSIYEAAAKQIKGGGLEALTHYLVNRDYRGFHDWTPPPMTRAKLDLIDASLGSTERFAREWTSGMIPLPCVPARSEDLYKAFRAWCSEQGAKGPHQGLFAAEIVKYIRGVKDRKRWRAPLSGTQQSIVIFPEGHDSGMHIDDISRHIERFADAVKTYRRDKLGGV